MARTENGDNLKYEQSVVIKYKFPEEKEFMLFFAKKLSDEWSEKIINEEKILTIEDAEHFSRFYWRMVDCSIEHEKMESFPWSEGSEFWCEKVSHLIAGFLHRTGFADVWNKVADEQ
jgi:hypothetical protein